VRRPRRHSRHRRRSHASPCSAVAGRVAVFAPSPILTVTIERGTERPEVHLHPGGQGFWVARMNGREPGRRGRSQLRARRRARERAPRADEHRAAGTTDGRRPNTERVYVHDHRSGERREIVSVDSRPLTRHATDELYGIALAAGMDADVTLITGSRPHDIVEPDLYRRLVSDLSDNGKVLIADLTGSPLRATLEGGVELLKLGSEEFVDEGLATSHDYRISLRALDRCGERAPAGS
jgi:1-phosphofructokinase